MTSCHQTVPQMHHFRPLTARTPRLYHHFDLQKRVASEISSMLYEDWGSCAILLLELPVTRPLQGYPRVSLIGLAGQYEVSAFQLIGSIF